MAGTAVAAADEASAAALPDIAFDAHLRLPKISSARVGIHTWAESF